MSGFEMLFADDTAVIFLCVPLIVVLNSDYMVYKRLRGESITMKKNILVKVGE